MLAGAAAVASAILLMLLTRSLHPPGGAAAISAVIGGESHTLARLLVCANPGDAECGHPSGVRGGDQ